MDLTNKNTGPGVLKVKSQNSLPRHIGSHTTANLPSGKQNQASTQKGIKKESSTSGSVPTKPFEVKNLTSCPVQFDLTRFMFQQTQIAEKQLQAKKLEKEKKEKAKED